MVKQVRWVFPAVVLLTVAALIPGCGGGGGTPSSEVQSVSSELAALGPTQQARVIIGFKQQGGTVSSRVIADLGGEIHYSFTIVPAVAATVSGKALASLRRRADVEYIEPDVQVQASGETVPWGVAKIGAVTVQTQTPPDLGVGVNVAILDTGIDYTHPDLAANYKGGVNYVRKRVAPMDDNGHGTHVAGIAAAVKGNDIGVFGVAPGASLYALKVLDSSGSGFVSDIVAALQWCTSKSNGIQIASMSFGSSVGSKTLQRACNNTYKAGILLVAAAGNSGNSIGLGDTISYPARYASVVAVGATDATDVRPYWSSTGAELAVVAPGVSIYSTWPGASYATLSGTSMACPHVTGTAALMIAKGITGPANIRAKLTSTADDLGTIGFDQLYGWGLVDAVGATQP